MNSIRDNKFKIFYWNKKQCKKNLKALLFICIFTLLAIDTLKFKILNKKFYDISSSTYSVISYPIHLIQDRYYKLKNYFSLVNSKQDIYLENQQLKKLIQNIELIKEENKNLRRLVNFQDNFHFSKVTSRVVVESIDNFDKQYLLNIGLHNGVKKGYAIVDDSKLIGRIIDVNDRSSKMQLISSNQSKIPVMVLGTEYSGIMSGGKKEGYLKLFYLPQQAKIDDNAIVVTSGEGGYMPYGIYVGKIKKINGQFFVKTCLKCENSFRLVSVLKPEENFANAKIKN
ncbi:rod shape-determining protein MreC [Rickettsiales endosymbiont of Trichoplax sp. H2]|uniref:rod shape-determining protein MreC n=1 Tax=Rickettsiales endosymbiont of Trichoplax sp. H2 TaxID=2021221 RepID=UPI0012B33004|nr:rod shape-determining protein MreC [Rickettsiales endosymbiont of Trichoplax sp. H2]MSO13417.1 Cell shape-determining protein MreC [Rickettsiales endosymbiont of Trichoplax sp. H2]